MCGAKMEGKRQGKEDRGKPLCKYITTKPKERKNAGTFFPKWLHLPFLSVTSFPIGGCICIFRQTWGTRPVYGHVFFPSLAPFNMV